MKIAIGADHRGYDCKEAIKKEITQFNTHSVEWLDVGAFNDERSDYPEFAIAVARKMVAGEVDFGVLLCGTGVGMAVAANRFSGIYAALVWNDEIARLSREHDKSNILVLPCDFISCQQAISMVRAWLSAEFKKGRYQKRIDMIDALGQP